MDGSTVVMIIACVFGAIFLCWKTGDIARTKYGTALIMSWAFALVFVGTWLLLVGVVAGGAGSTQAGAYLLGALLFIGGGGFVNVKRTNVLFGLWMTFVQFISSIAIIVPIVYVIAWRKTTRSGIPFTS